MSYEAAERDSPVICMYIIFTELTYEVIEWKAELCQVILKRIVFRSVKLNSNQIDWINVI